MIPMTAAVPPIKTLSLETDPRRSTPSRRLELPVSLSDIVPPSLNRGSAHPTARVLSSGRFCCGLPPSPSLAIITPPGCPERRSRPLTRPLLLILPTLEYCTQAGTEKCSQLPRPNNEFASDSITRVTIPVSLPPPPRRSLPFSHLRPRESPFRVRAFPGERSTESKGSILLYSDRVPSSMVPADTSVGSKDAVPKSGSHHHG